MWIWGEAQRRYPIPKDKFPLYVNEPWLIDKTLPDYHIAPEPDNNDDNVRIYVPIDLNNDAILRRLDQLIVHYEEANGFEFTNDVNITRLCFYAELIYNYLLYR